MKIGSETQKWLGFQEAGFQSLNLNGTDLSSDRIQQRLQERTSESLSGKKIAPRDILAERFEEK